MKTSAKTEGQNSGDSAKVSSTIQKVHGSLNGFDTASLRGPCDGGNLPSDTSTGSETNFRIGGGSKHDHGQLFDMPLSPIPKAQSQANHIRSSSAKNAASALSSDIGDHPGTNAAKSRSHPPSENQEGPAASELPATGDREPILPCSDKSADAFETEPEQATLPVRGAKKPSKPRNNRNPKSDEDLEIEPPSMERFGLPKSKQAIKTDILRLLRQQSFDQKIPSAPEEMLKYDNSDGYIYIFSSPPFVGYFKIGSTKNRIEDRVKAWEDRCKIECTFICDPKLQAFPHYGRVERLVHAELANDRRSYKCVKCKKGHYLAVEKKTTGGTKEVPANQDKKFRAGTKHGEWFQVEQQRASAAVAKWRKWVVDNEPYRKDGSLRAKWIWKVKQAENSVEMDWGVWLRKKIPKVLREPEPEEGDWDWDRWGQMRWDDWALYLFDQGTADLRTTWPQVERVLWYPGLIVWILVGVAPFLAYSVCGGGKSGLFASLKTIIGLGVLWLLGVVLKS